jgi:hypothetical protein
MVGRKRKASAKKKAADAAVDPPTPAIVPTIEEVQEPVPPAQPPLPTQEEELNTRAPAYRWFDASERALLEALQEAIRRGEQSDTGFHVRVWDRVIEGFVSKGFTTITRDQLKNKVVYFKGRWKLFNQLTNLSGWGIDEDNDQLLASDELWAAAITRKATSILLHALEKTFVLVGTETCVASAMGPYCHVCSLRVGSMKGMAGG